DDPLLPMNISSISEIIKPTLEGRLRKACKQLSYLTTPIGAKNSRNPYLICDICGGAHEVDECKLPEQVCLSGRDIYDDPSLLRFYQNDDIPPWGNIRRRTKGEEGPEWVVRSNFKDNLSNFMLEKDLHAKGLGEMLNQQWREMHNRFSQILATFEKSQKSTPKTAAPTFAITTKSGTTPRDPPYPTPPNSTTVGNTNRTIEEEGSEDEEIPPYRTKIPLSRLNPLNHPVGNDPYAKGGQGISKLKPTRMSIQLADRSVKYPLRVCENMLVKLNKFIFSVDFVVLEMDEDELVPIILGRPFLTTARVVIDVHEGKLSPRVRNETVTFNIGKSVRSTYSHDDYLYC
ncbi:RNA-directed DNA polymerase, partial [Tanacetum coccineum]